MDPGEPAFVLPTEDTDSDLIRVENLAYEHMLLQQGSKLHILSGANLSRFKKQGCSQCDGLISHWQLLWKYNRRKIVMGVPVGSTCAL
ncbi:unnamed protein product [Urochloa humidicola]